MKKSVIIVLISLSSLISACKPGRDAMYEQLDRALDLKTYYDAAYDQMQDSLYNVYTQAADTRQKWDAAFSLEKIFFYHNMDSCSRYIQEMLRLDEGDRERHAISLSCYASVLHRQDSLENSYYVFRQVDTSALTEDAFRIWSEAGYNVLTRMDREDNKWKSLREELVLQWWKRDSTNIQCATRYNRILPEEIRKERAVDNLLSCRIETPNDSAKLYYFLGDEYLLKNDTQKAKECYAASAVIDIRLSAKAYSALFALARILFKEGDIERANRYMTTTLEDTRYSHYRSQYEKSISSALAIMDALLAQKAQKQRAYMTAAIAVSLLFAVAIVFIILLSRFSARLIASQKALGEVSKIKDSFLAGYMEKSVDYLKKVDQYRSSLRRASKNGGQEAVQAMLREPSFAGQEFDNLLEAFDSSFLGIFPNFVDKVNMHMQEGHQLSMPSPNSLSTELRILALIRMGISKRSRIAKVLNLSVTTVYAYHYRLQRDSLHPDNSFDTIIAGL